MATCRFSHCVNGQRSFSLHELGDHNKRFPRITEKKVGSRRDAYRQEGKAGAIASEKDRLVVFKILRNMV